MATIRAFAMISLAILMVGTADAQTPGSTEKEPLKPVMRVKLDHAKQILEAVAVEDYDKLLKNAEAISLLSLEGGWKIYQTEEYVKQSGEFRKTAGRIAQAAKDEDLHRAAFEYIALTVRCVECHNYLRKQRPPRLGTIDRSAKGRD